MVEEVIRNIANLTDIGFEVTDACNLRCRYCAYGAMYLGSGTRGLKKMPPSVPAAVFGYLSAFWSRHPSDSGSPVTRVSFYGGEPLLGMDFIRRAVGCSEKVVTGRRFEYNLTTNAVLLDRYMDYLVEKDFTILVSLDGDESANAYRVRPDGGSSFASVVSSVRALQRKYPDFFEKNVGFNAVLHDLNSVEGARQYIHSEFGHWPMVNELNPSNLNPERLDEFLKIHRSITDSIRSSASEDALSDALFFEDPRTNDLVRYIQGFSGNVFQDYSSLFHEPCRRVCGGTCTPFRRKMFVTVDGTILQCERIPHSFALGRVAGGRVELDPSEVARRYSGWIGKVAPSCRDCALSASCPQCVLEIDGLSGGAVRCPQHMGKDEFRRWEAEKMEWLTAHPQLYGKIVNGLILG